MQAAANITAKHTNTPLPENFNQEVAKLGGAATALGNSASKLDGSTAALNESVNKFGSSIKNAIRSLKAL